MARRGLVVRNGPSHVLFAHLHVPDREHRFDPFEELAPAAFGPRGLPSRLAPQSAHVFSLEQRARRLFPRLDRWRYIRISGWVGFDERQPRWSD
jgi:hypothetical protein